MVLRLTRSFYDAEDPELTPKLMKELPGILNWAIGGWRRLRERGRFVMPESSRDVLQSLEELGSPIATFVRDECVLNDGARVDTDALYRKWNVWCSREGFTKVTERAVFGRDLSAAFASIRRRRGSDNQYFYQGIGLPEDVL